MPTKNQTNSKNDSEEVAKVQKVAYQLHNRNDFSARYSRVVGKVTIALGSGPAVGFALLVIVIWAATGPIAGFSDTWQLVINTFTTLVTFIMVFIIQNAQNRDGRAMHIKLDEILRAVVGADGSLSDIEDLSQSDLNIIEKAVRKAAESNSK